MDGFTHERISFTEERMNRGGGIVENRKRNDGFDFEYGSRG